MRGAESLSVTSAAFAGTTHSHSALIATPITSIISSVSILPTSFISVVVSILSGLLLLMRPAARYVEVAAGPNIYRHRLMLGG